MTKVKREYTNCKIDKLDKEQLEVLRKVFLKEKQKKAENIRAYQNIVKSSGSKKFDVDKRVLVKLNQNKIYTDFKGRKVKIRDYDMQGNTGAEHIAQAKHQFKEEDIVKIGNALAGPNKYIETDLKKGNLYILNGVFGINNNMQYLIVAVGVGKKDRNTIKTVYLTDDDNYKELINKYGKTKKHAMRV
ncbi:MAG: hypothetical protein J1F31_04800 [Erysipelotrichales bacterium]|nr:hypothetical protein [Erysipelotrichales bacterium]